MVPYQEGRKSLIFSAVFAEEGGFLVVGAAFRAGPFTGCGFVVYLGGDHIFFQNPFGDLGTQTGE